MDDLNNFETQLTKIQDNLGNEALHRIMLDAALTQDFRSIFHTANPVLKTRRLFDREYDFKVADWGGAYPRPFFEILENTW